MAALSSTRKFSVIDPPGFSQPISAPAATLADAPVSSSAPPSSAGARGKGQGSRALESSGTTMDAGASVKIGGPFKRAPSPQWLRDRDAVYAAIKERRQRETEGKSRRPITVTMPDGTVLEKDKKGEPFLAWQTCPIHVAAAISQGLADSAVVAKVTYSDMVDYDRQEQGDAAKDVNEGAVEDEEVAADQSAAAELWDLTRPLVGNVSKLEFLKFEEDREAKTVFWHSSAHILGESLEHVTGAFLTIGPPLKSGFYYDS
jgi:threonyl-tRNA synthetase